MTEAPARERPLSPHTGVWRWHLTMATSILHRVTGVGLYGGALVLAGWAVALASGPDAYAAYVGLLVAAPGQVVLFGLTVCLFYHLAKGIQHLVWDTGRGFSLAAANFGAMVAIAVAIGASAAVWAIAAMTGSL